MLLMSNSIMRMDAMMKSGWFLSLNIERYSANVKKARIIKPGNRPR